MKRLAKHGILLSLVVASSLFTSCASMLDIGHEHFACKDTAKGGVCASVHQVYEERYKLANEKITKKSSKPTGDEGAYSSVSENGIPVIKEVKKKGGKAQINVNVVKQKPYAKPVRIPPKIAKIWIQPYVDRHGDLVDGRYIYVIVRQGGWLLPDGTRIYDRKQR